ncbi:hypothetical protein DFH08DRAFT_938526 [Mycena albidolilacea]|uniref:Restriction of telomere capping protein 4 C-terminal domain-containing protein n=1 Tax=Mycena albidolilacea TaxID=1033008 RepID=A0AAD7EPF5_9AGAR|nr:hypothetical protein DFH08DRAFT_938526 [Mycena albidolilacea]
MPVAKTKLNAAEQLHQLQDAFNRQKEEIEALKKAAAEAARKNAKTSRKQNLIPKPNGQAGKNFTIQDEMGLRHDAERYNRLYRIVKDYTHEYLSVHKTISQQNRMRLDEAIAIIGKEFKYFGKFEGFWPTRRNNDSELEKKAEASDRAGATITELEAATVDSDEDEENLDTNNAKTLTQKPNPLHPICRHVLVFPDLPKKINARILSLYSSRQILIDEGGLFAPGVYFFDQQICAAIRQEEHKDQYHELGRKQNWPENINFFSAYKRVLHMRDYLTAMITDKTYLETSDAWNSFISDINHKIFAFSKSDSPLDYSFALLGRRCGFYGPTGAYIINSTITRVLANDEQKLGYALYGTLDDIITENYERFDDYDPDCELISLREFIYFVLTPYAATLLISDDLDLDMDAAANVRHQSNIFGDVMQPDLEDPSIESLHQRNIDAMQGCSSVFLPRLPSRRPHNGKPADSANKTIQDSTEEDVKPKTKAPQASKSEKPVQLTTKPYILSVADFAEPDPLAKRKAQAEKKKPEKKPVAASKVNPIKSEYTTRSKTQAQAHTL